MESVKETVKEASISIACLLDDMYDFDPSVSDYVFIPVKDLQHIQNQITNIENSLTKGGF